MSSLDLTVAVVIVAVVVIAAIISHLRSQPRPKINFFRCAGCGKTTRHTNRTIEAWQLQRTKLFCGPCHSQWVASRPPPEYEPRPGSDYSTRSGCLGVVALAFFVPSVCIYFWAYA